MALNNSNDAVIEQRREHVAALLLAGKTQRQIVEELDKLMPDDGHSLATINADIKAIKAEWRKSSKDKLDKHIATQSARVENIIIALWPNRDHPRVAEVLLQALKRQAELFGTDKPTKQDITSEGEKITSISIIEVVKDRGEDTGQDAEPV